MNVSTKRLLSILLSLAMVLAMLPMAVFAETATTLYVKPNANWIKDGARFAAYFFGNGEKWLDCTDADGDGVYEVEAPAGYPNVIFCRMNPKAAANNWNNKWNQTSDLKVPTDSKVCYVVAENTWDKGAGQWVEYTPEGGAGETEPTTASPIKYSVAGEAGLCGSAWTPEDINNMMLDEDGDGIYTITYSEVAAGSYKFKVTDGTWNNAWPAQDYVLKLEAKSNVTISFDTAAKAVKVEVEALEEPPVTEPTEPTPATYIVAGVAELCGSAWTPADTNNLMADEDGDGIYSITYTAIKAGTYQFKVTDGTWDNCWGGTAADGNYEFTLAVDADVTINFNSADNSIEVVSDGIGEEPTEPSEPFVPGVQEYCLVGYINGADYGCNEDYETVGEYIFVDGTLTTSFTADSYIFIKTTDNANWYLSKTYCSETTGTFVKNAEEKMFVPGNVELTFTLIENEDGTLTLSYVTGDPVEPPVTEPSETEPTVPSESEPTVDVVYYVAGSFNGWTNPDANYVLTQNEDGTYSITFAVTAGEIELKVTDGTWDNCWGNNGDNVKVNATTDGNITVNFNAASGSVVVTGDCLGEVVEPEQPEGDPMTIISMHVAGAAGLCGTEWDPAANQMSSGMGIYSITFENVAAGTYEFKFVANGTWALNWASGIAIASGETQTAWFNAMGNSSITVEKDGSTVTLSFNMTTMDLVTGEGATMTAEIVAPEAPAADALVLGDNALALESGDIDGNTWTFTATEAGTLFINITALAKDNGDGLLEEIPAEYIGMVIGRQYSVVINGAPCYAYPAEVSVAAGDVVTVSISSGMGVATNLTLNLSMTAGEGGEGGEVEPAAPGTSDNPIIIESLPYEITVDGEHDLYYTYTVETDGILTITFNAGNFVSGLVDYTKVDGVYYVNVTAGEVLALNPWGSSAGSYTIAYGEAPAIENVSVYFDASLFGWTNVNAYAWDADGIYVGADWPGVAMTQNEEGIWTAEIPGNAAFILFNNGEYYQTGDMDFAADTLYNGINSAIYGTELVTNFYVTGDGVFGEWASDNANGIMTNNGNGIFTATISGVEAGTYGIKVTDGTWINSWGEWGENVKVEVAEKSDVIVTFNLNEQTVTYEAVPVAVEDPVVIPTLALKAPALEFKDMIKVIAFFTVDDMTSVEELGMITYTEKVDVIDINTAAHVIPGADYEESSARYFASSQGIHAKFLGDTVYLACYAKLTDGTYVYTKLAPYSPITYATNQLKNSTNMELKQLVAAMLNYGAAAQVYFNYNTDVLANSTLTAEQIALPEAYRADMVATAPTADADKQGIFANNKGFSVRKPAVSFEGAFSINYWFTPAYTPVDGITLYYWTEADFAAADVLTVDNATGAIDMVIDNNQYRADIEGIAAKDLSKTVYVAAVYSDGTTTWTSGVLGYSIGAYCSSQATKGGAMADLAMATAVYGYHAKAYFG